MTYIALESIKLDDPSITELNAQLKVSSSTKPGSAFEIGIPNCKESLPSTSLPTETGLGQTEEAQLWREIQVDVIELVDFLSHCFNWFC